MARATATAAKPKKAAASSSHASYKDMIKDAILSLKERNGSSRQALKKYVRANNNISVLSDAVFGSQFNRALKAGVDSGDFTQPKGPSGPVKLAKKEAKPVSAKPAQKKAVAKKDATPKKDTAAPKKDTTKPTTKTTPKKPAAKKDAPAAKKPAAKPKVVSTKPKKSPLKPAVTEKATVLNTTKSGRVTKTTAKPVTGRRTAKATTRKSQSKKGAAAAGGGGEGAQAGESE